nr:hypothetical protein KPHV_02840 [Kitasatospora purpeofusca]
MELDRTRRRAAFAEARCELLERQLEVVEQQQGFDPWALRAEVAVFVEIYLERREHALGRD